MRFRFNEKKAAQAAAHLLKLSGGKIDFMVLIKLLFLADREALVGHGQPITGARMVSMPYGPVVSEVLTLLNERPRGPRVWDEYVSEISGYDVVLKAQGEPESDELSRFELRQLSDVHKRFGHWKPWALVKWLHDNIPEWKDPEGGALTIEYADVLRKHDFSEERIQSVRRDAELLWALGSLGSPG